MTSSVELSNSSTFYRHTHTHVEDTLNLIESNRTVNRWTFGYNERITLLLLTVLRNKVFTHYKHTHTSHTHPTICSAQNSFGNEFSQFVCCVSIVSFRSRLNCITRTCDCQMAPFGKNAPKWMPMQRCVNWNWKSHFANRSGEPSIFLRLFLLFFGVLVRMVRIRFNRCRNCGNHRFVSEFQSQCLKYVSNQFDWNRWSFFSFSFVFCLVGFIYIFDFSKHRLLCSHTRSLARVSFKPELYFYSMRQTAYLCSRKNAYLYKL